jgi:hypothetical protein
VRGRQDVLIYLGLRFSRLTCNFNMNRVLWQFTLVGVGGGAGAYIAAPYVASGAAAISNSAERLGAAVPGKALAALLALMSSQMNYQAAQIVSNVVNSQGYAEFLETLNTLGELFESLGPLE